MAEVALSEEELIKLYGFVEMSTNANTGLGTSRGRHLPVQRVCAESPNKKGEKGFHEPGVDITG